MQNLNLNTIHETIEIILSIVTFIVGFLWWLYKNMESVKDLLEKVRKSYRNFISFIDLPRRLLARRMNSKDFMSWQDKVLEKIYGKELFSELLGTYYPVCSIDFDQTYGFDKVNSLCCDENNKNEPLLREKDEVTYTSPDIYKTEIMTHGVEKNQEALENELKLKRKLMGTGRWWSGYNWFTARSMNDGNHIGYVLDYADINKGKIKKLHLAVGDYKLTLLTSHILTYELYMAYCELKKAGKENDEIDLKTLWPRIPFRRYIHHVNGCFDENGNVVNVGQALFSGLGRYSLLSVQCMVMMCTTDEDQEPSYRTFFGKRSKSTHKVSTKLGCYQFPPSGGFDLYDNMTRMDHIKKSCKLNMALMREYLEEIFNIKEYAKFDGANDCYGIDRIENDPCVKSIKAMLNADLKDKRFKENAKKAYFTTVGANVDLINLRLSVNCLLVINDYNYYAYTLQNGDNKSDEHVYRKKFVYNEEIDRRESCAEQLKTQSDLESVEITLRDPCTLRGKRNIVEDSVSLYIQGKKAFEEYIASVRKDERK